MRKILISVLLSFMCISSGYASDKKTEKKDTTVKESQYDKLFKEQHEVAEGLLTFHKVKEDLYLELPLKLLGRPMLLGSTVSAISDNANAIVGSKPKDPLPFSFSVSGKKLCMEIPSDAYVR